MFCQPINIFLADGVTFGSFGDGAKEVLPDGATALLVQIGVMERKMNPTLESCINLGFSVRCQYANALEVL